MSVILLALAIDETTCIRRLTAETQSILIPRICLYKKNHIQIPL